MRDDSQTADESLVVALGGNTLLGEQGPWTADRQFDVIRETAREISGVLGPDTDVVLTHGNGPQIGNLLLQQENTPETPQLPLDVLVAETQAQIGYMLQQALDNELGGETGVVTVVTQVVVDADDPAFENPTKPVGPFYTEAEADEKDFETHHVSTGERPYRRVVPSPEPTDIVEVDEIERLVAREPAVICVGGGGIPVVREGGLRGVEAVVDKDAASRLLAAELGATTLVVLTDVEHAYVDFDTPEQRPLRQVTPDELRTHLDNGEFGTGSMRPKVRACLGFVAAGGERAIITTPDRLGDALAGQAGTQVRQ